MSSKNASPQRPRRRPPQPVEPPESFKHLVLQIVSDRSRTMNLLAIIATCGLVVLVVLGLVGVLVYLLLQHSGWPTWLTAGVSCLGTGGVALAVKRLKGRK